MDIDGKKAITYLAAHIGGDLVSELFRGKLKEREYAAMEAWAKSIGQKKYRKSVFRGFVLKGGKQLIDLLADKPLALSAFEGTMSHAESWSADPKSASVFAIPTSPNVLMEARPAPKDIVMQVDDLAMKAIRERDDIRDIYKSTVEYYGRKEREVLVRTGNRKYSLCRNVLMIGIPAWLVEGGTRWNIIDPLLERLRNPEDFKKHLAGDRDKHWRFACNGGKLVWLPSEAAYGKWLGKLSSR